MTVEVSEECIFLTSSQNRGNVSISDTIHGYIEGHRPQKNAEFDDD